MSGIRHPPRVRTVLLVASLGLAIAMLGPLAIAIPQVAARWRHTEILRETALARAVLTRTLAYRRNLLLAQAHVAADEPRLKAVATAFDVPAGAFLDVTTSMKAALRADVFILTDGAGDVRVDPDDPDAPGRRLGGTPLLAAALQGAESAAIWARDGRLFQMSARRLAFGSTVVGAIVLGYLMNDDLAGALRQQSGFDVLIVAGGRVVARALGPALEGIDPDGLDIKAVLAGGPATLDLRGRPYVALSERVSSEGKEGVDAHIVLLRPLDELLAPANQLTRVVLWALGAEIAIAVLLAILVARRFSRPLVDLAAATDRIAAGDLETRVHASGAAEIATLATSMNRMTGEISEARRSLLTKDRLVKEMEIARRIQTSVLPRAQTAGDLRIACAMITASEVGGDYCDAIPVGDGCWIGIGDVSGHGLDAGLMMLMVQGAIAGAVRARPEAPPREVLMAANRAVRENIRNRLGRSDHVTLTLLRYHAGGRLTFAGAHEDILLCRSGASACERIATRGTWLGIVDDIGATTHDAELTLDPGDLLALCTDGILEARSGGGERFGPDRVCAAIMQDPRASLEEVLARVLGAAQAWAPAVADDMTLVLARRVPAPGR